VVLIDRVPWPLEPTPQPRGRPKTDSDRLVLKALVSMMIRRLYTADALLPLLDQEDAVAVQLRPLWREHGRFPSRRTWERRLAVLPQRLPGLMGCVGRHVGALLTPWATHGRAAACDSPPLATGEGVWHKTPREQGVIPQSSSDTAAGWSKSGWHGGWSGWTLPLAVTGGAIWRPRAAELTVANRGDNEVASLWLKHLPGEVRDVLGDTHDHDPERRNQCHRRGCELVATRRGPSPHRDGGVEGRNIFHTRRSQAIEPCKGWFNNVVEWRVKMPVKGVQRSQRLALGAVVIYQLVVLYQHEQHLPLGKGIKPFLRAA
jgi:hypothetical protein